MWPQQVTMWGDKGNMHVQYINTVIKIYINIHRDPCANMLSANYGVERPGGFQMPLRSCMTSYMRDEYGTQHGTTIWAKNG